MPGFAIYVDEVSYVLTTEGDAYHICSKVIPFSREDIRMNNFALPEDLPAEEQELFIDERIEELEVFYAALPPCEMEIQVLKHTPP